MPVKQNFQTKIGNTTPDLVWGITNTFKYKNFTLSFTLDGRVGGLSYSKTHQMLWNTGAGIDTDTQWRYEEVVNGNKTYIGQGVKVGFRKCNSRSRWQYHRRYTRVCS